jgi:hypothetical protein
VLPVDGSGVRELLRYSTNRAPRLANCRFESLPSPFARYHTHDLACPPHEDPRTVAPLPAGLERDVSKRETKRRRMATNRQRQPPFWVEVTSEFRNLGRPTTKRAAKIDRLNPTIAGGATPTSTPLTSVHQRVVPRPATNGSALGPLLSLSGGVGNLYS